jgi:RHS repeat-associated protein
VADIATELLPLLTSGVGGLNGSKGGAVPSSYTDPLLGTDLANFLSSSRPYNNARPKAFLNWMVVGEDYNAVSSTNHVSAVQIPAMNAGDTLKRRNGWVYIYLSNESAQDVYFDNLVINHKHGPLLEQKDYYPFGMDNPALSTKALKANYKENRNKFNDGSELQSKEFNDSSGLEVYDFGARTYDPQIGRFLQIDPLALVIEDWSPYAYAYNNPILFNDPLGLLADTTHLEPVIVVGYCQNVVSKSSPDVAGSVGPPPSGGSIDGPGGGGTSSSSSSTSAPNNANQNNGDHNIVTDIAYELNKFNPLANFYNAISTYISGHDSYGVPQSNSEATAQLASIVPIGRVATVTEEIVSGEIKNVTVYISKTSSEVIQYVGITNNLAKRAAAHLSEKGINIIPLMENLSRSDAKAVEQALIEINGLGTNGGPLLNKINSISSSNPEYANQLTRGYELLKSIGFK